MDGGAWRAIVPRVAESDMTDVMKHTHPGCRYSKKYLIRCGILNLWKSKNGPVQSPCCQSAFVNAASYLPRPGPLRKWGEVEKEWQRPGMRVGEGQEGKEQGGGRDSSYPKKVPSIHPKADSLGYNTWVFILLSCGYKICICVCARVCICHTCAHTHACVVFACVAQGLCPWKKH